MLTKNMYPTCAKTFRSWRLSNPKFHNFYYKMGQPLPFDVTLRDGLQGLSRNDQTHFTSNKKLEIYKDIVSKYEPKNIEIGSIVSEKVLPVFKDTLKIFETINTNQRANKIFIPNNYILIPNKEKLRDVINNTYINYFSFITSTSNSFQLKNTKKTLKESDKEMYEMLYLLDVNTFRTQPANVKLYVSCINECPIEGKIDNDFIVNRILNLSKMNIDNICLSDTCGTITLDDFEYIIETCLFFGLPPSKLSLHLHVNPDKVNEIRKIIHMALDFKVTNFDVSSLNTGGCSVTMDKNSMNPNLSYDLYYESFVRYIEKKCNI
jgi:hydroxymethylglutaryl-CoA lyase